MSVYNSVYNRFLSVNKEKANVEVHSPNKVNIGVHRCQNWRTLVRVHFAACSNVGMFDRTVSVCPRVHFL